MSKEKREHQRRVGMDERRRQLRGFTKRSTRYYFAYRHVNGSVSLLKGPSLDYVKDRADEYRQRDFAVDVHVLEHEFIPTGGVSPRDVNEWAMQVLRDEKPTWFEEAANG